MARKGIDDYLERRRQDLARLGKSKPKPTGKKIISSKHLKTGSRKPKYF